MRGLSRPAADGLEKRGPYALRHSFATEAWLGSTIVMVNKHYGHLARDGEDLIRARLEGSGVEGASEADAD